MTDGGSHRTTSRRRLLKVLGATGASLTLAGCPSPSTTDRRTDRTASPQTTTERQTHRQDSPTSPRTEPPESRERRTIEGAGKRVNDELDVLLSDDVEVYFPPGEYRLDPIRLRGSNWSLVGDDATLVVPDDVTGPYFDVDGENWTIEGFTIDLTADRAAPVNHLKGTDWAFRNVEFVGRMGDPDRRQNSWLLFPAVTAPDASGLVENVRAMDGSAKPGQSSNRGLTWFGQNNVGTLIWRGCEFSRWANNTLYGANSAGPLVLEDCLFQNTNVGVRVGGNTVVRGCTWIQNGKLPIQRWSGDSNGRGLWINSNTFTPGEITVEDCTFIMTGAHATRAITSNHEVDDVSIRNTQVVQGNDFSAVEFPTGGTTTIEQTTITGGSKAPAISLSNRNDSSIETSCIQQPGAGIRISDSENCLVADSNINVGGQRFQFRDSKVETRNNTRKRPCKVQRLSQGNS
jgi:hypothetical protein